MCKLTSLMDASRRQEIPGPEMENFITHQTAGSTSFLLQWFLWSSKPCPVMQNSPGGCHTASESVFQLRHPELRELQSYKGTASKP